jgi:hypothetical protein
MSDLSMDAKEDFLKSLKDIGVDPDGRYGKFLIEMRERPDGIQFDMMRGDQLLKEYGTKGR